MSITLIVTLALTVLGVTGIVAIANNKGIRIACQADWKNRIKIEIESDREEPQQK